MLEIRTIYAVTAVVLAVLFCFLLLIRISSPALRGVQWILCAYAAGASGIGIMFFRSHLPLFISVIVSNLLICLVNVFLYWGIQEILRARRRLFWILPVSLIATLIPFLYYTYIDDRVTPRIITYSVIAITGDLLIALLLFTEGHPRTRISRIVMAGLFLFWALANTDRMIAAMRHQPVAIFQELPSATAKILLVPVVEVVVIGLGLLWLSAAHMQIDLEDLARTDSLTGLLNRRALETDAAHQLRLARAASGPLALILIDLDHFKQINDHHGHAGGDVALTMAAHCIRQNLRNYELVGRFGGEEFLVFLPNTSASQATQIAERLRACLADLTVPYLETEIQLSASLGVTTFDPTSDSWDDLLRRADQALYQAKFSGRNRVAVG